MKRVKQVTLGFFGIIITIIGAVFILLPVVPGWPVVFIGLILLSLESPTLDTFLNNLFSKNKKLENIYLKYRHWLRSNSGYDI